MCVSQRWATIILLLTAVLLPSCAGEVIDTPTSSWTPLPTVPNLAVIPGATATVQPASQEGGLVFCLDDAQFLEDLTIPDQTLAAAGEMLDKRWSVKNSGTCDWGAGYHLIKVSRDDFRDADEIALFPARAGSQAVWQVLLTAPLEAGEHISFWQARSPQGELFGEQVYVWIVVATPTPAPTSRGTPTN